VLGGTISVGALVSFSALVVFANNAIIILLSLWDQGQRVSVLLSRVRDVFEVEPEQGRDHDHLAPVPSLSGQVTLEGVGFRYSPHGARCCPTSTSTSSRARRWPSWVAAARARPRSPSASSGCSSRPRARSATTAST
jgi:ABC-type multidrug transport system fused ATPase/permease subunit